MLPMRKPATGEPCAGDPQARFGGRGGNFPTPITGGDRLVCDTGGGSLVYDTAVEPGRDAKAQGTRRP